MNRKIMDNKKVNISIKQLEKVHSFMNDCANKFILRNAIDQLKEQLKDCDIPNVVKSLPNDDEIEQAANEEATRIFDDTGNGSKWYARNHGFTDGVEWIKNYLAK